MFPINQKQHDIQIRNTEKYVVNHAKKERFKNSSIPYMQRLLNNDEQNKK